MKSLAFLFIGARIVCHRGGHNTVTLSGTKMVCKPTKTMCAKNFTNYIMVICLTMALVLCLRQIALIRMLGLKCLSSQAQNILFLQASTMMALPCGQVKKQIKPGAFLGTALQAVLKETCWVIYLKP